MSHPLEKYFNSASDPNGPTDLRQENQGIFSHPLNKYFSAPESKDETAYGIGRKVGRIGTQVGLSIAEGAALPYNVGAKIVSGLTSSGREGINQESQEEYQRLLKKEEKGTLNPIEQAAFGRIKEIAEDKPRGAIRDYLKQGVPDLSFRGIAQMAATPAGIDLNPEGWLEKSADWAALLKNPTKLGQLGLNLDSVKKVLPGFKEITRGLGAGAGLELAEQGEFGPLGTMAAAIVGDLVGGSGGNLARNLGKFAKNPKLATAGGLGKVSAFFKSPEKLKLQNDLNDAFKKAGVPIDIGTASGSRIAQFIQARLDQSALTGPALEAYKKQVADTFVQQYKEIADKLGQQKFATAHEAGTYGKQVLSDIRDAELARIRSTYDAVRQEAKGQQAVFGTPELAKKVEQLEQKLTPGSVKSPDTKKVLTELENLKKDLYDAEGRVKPASVEGLLNNKINLNDMLNYDVHAGTKDLLKGIVKDIDNALLKYGRNQNPKFLKNYQSANRDFAKHAQTFRNKNISAILGPKNDPQVLMHKMNSVEGVKNVKKALSKTPEGKEVFENLARFKLEELIGKNMVDSVSGQMKYGTFAKLLEDPLAKSVVKELLPPSDYSKLVTLQDRSGDLANTAQKFYNNSRTGVGTTDFGIAASAIWDMVNLFHGNPFPLLRTGAGLFAAHKLAKWITDPEFINAMQDSMRAAQRNNVPLMQQAAQRLSKIIGPAAIQGASGEQQPENVSLPQ